MRVWILQIWDRLRGSFWFVPLGMMLAAAMFAGMMAEVDSRVTLDDDGPFRWLKVNAETARSTLSLLAGSMITLSGVVFSMTMVTLSLTSSQFGSRLLRTAMADLTMQGAMGAFLSAALYCLVVMRLIPVNEDSPFVPHFAVFIGPILAFAGLVMMIVFVHHVGVSIQAQNVVAEVALDLNAAIDRVFPERLGEPHEGGDEGTDDDQPELGSRQDGDGPTLPALAEGYLQSVDPESLMTFARENDLVVELLYRPGDFVIKGSPVVRLLNVEAEFDEEKQKRLTGSLDAALVTGRSRTPRQDVCCAVNELVEVAVRALSPGINDPFTAVTCIDRMTAAMTRLLGRENPSAYRCDDEGQLRVIARPIPIPTVIETAFHEIGLYGAGDWMVTMRMLEGLEQLMKVAERKPDREAIVEQAVRLYRRALESRKDPIDQARLKALLERVSSTPGDEKAFES